MPQQELREAIRRLASAAAAAVSTGSAPPPTGSQAFVSKLLVPPRNEPRSVDRTGKATDPPRGNGGVGGPGPCGTADGHLLPPSSSQSAGSAQRNKHAETSDGQQRGGIPQRANRGINSEGGGNVGPIVGQAGEPRRPFVSGSAREGLRPLSMEMPRSVRQPSVNRALRGPAENVIRRTQSWPENFDAERTAGEGGRIILAPGRKSAGVGIAAPDVRSLPLRPGLASATSVSTLPFATTFGVVKRAVAPAESASANLKTVATSLKSFTEIPGSRRSPLDAGVGSRRQTVKRDAVSISGDRPAADSKVQRSTEGGESSTAGASPRRTDRDAGKGQGISRARCAGSGLTAGEDTATQQQRSVVELEGTPVEDACTEHFDQLESDYKSNGGSKGSSMVGRRRVCHSLSPRPSTSGGHGGSIPSPGSEFWDLHAAARPARRSAEGSTLEPSQEVSMAQRWVADAIAAAHAESASSNWFTVSSSGHVRPASLRNLNAVQADASVPAENTKPLGREDKAPSSANARSHSTSWASRGSMTKTTTLGESSADMHSAWAAV